VHFISIDLFGKVSVGKTTIFEMFADPQGRTLHDGGNLSPDPRIYYARCWILPNRWEDHMVFLADPKFDMRRHDLPISILNNYFGPTNVLVLVTDSTPEDVEAVARCIPEYMRIKPGLIIFIIANMQDCEGAVSPEEISRQTGIGDVLGISALDVSIKPQLEEFFEKAVKRYFMLISKRGEK
jgi:hypothetical protein